MRAPSSRHRPRPSKVDSKGLTFRSKDHGLPRALFGLDPGPVGDYLRARGVELEDGTSEPTSRGVHRTVGPDFGTVRLLKRQLSALRDRLALRQDPLWRNATRGGPVPEATDPTFYRSPAAAIAAPPEQLAYVAAFDPAGKQRDAMTVVDCDAGSSDLRRGGRLDGAADRRQRAAPLRLERLLQRALPRGPRPRRRSSAAT